MCSSSISFCALNPGPHSPPLMKSDIGSGSPRWGGGCLAVPGTAQAFRVTTAMRSRIPSFVTFQTIRSLAMESGPS
jgi:hypothetical protein